jgi:hypothetical protein
MSAGELQNLDKNIQRLKEQLAGKRDILGLFWFLCGNEVYTDSFFDKIVLKVLPDKHFTIP